MKPKTFKTKPLKAGEWQRLNFSQAMVKGFCLEKYQNSKILMIGAGAIGGNTTYGLVRKGFGCIDILDDDVVELQNLTRQFFYPKDLGKNKAIQLAKNLSEHGFFRTQLTGYPCRFQEMLENRHDFKGYHAIICGVDNNPTRVAVSNYSITNQIPVIHAAVSRDGNQMYCAVQEPGKACFGCMLPQCVNDNTYPCNLPGIIDVIQVVAGFVVFALDTVLSGRYREWNFKSISLDGSLPDASRVIAKKENCVLCGNPS